MSYDQWLYRAPEGSGPIGTWDQDQMCPLGNAEEVRRLLEHIMPGLKWKRSAAGDWSIGGSGGPAYEICLDYIKQEPVTIIRLRGASQVEARRLAEQLGMSAYDPQTGEQIV